MSSPFGEIIKNLRQQNNLSQQQLAERLFVDRSTVARWENGQRTPDALLLPRLALCLNVDLATLLKSIDEPEDTKNVILVDDERIILTGGLPILEKVLPTASITGFIKPSDAVKFAESHNIALAFLDIEMGKISGFDLCHKLLDINPRTNVVFLTSYIEHSFKAWDTGACGFLMKPLSKADVEKQLTRLRFPVVWGGTNE
ncbi:MAG: response regulator [Lachnospiraceae bacterium]|nr:response regulator [Lachnospiraceae bacterium]MBQ9608450.1 response regulator [Lachnospiraceae bacterium]